VRAQQARIQAKTNAMFPKDGSLGLKYTSPSNQETPASIEGQFPALDVIMQAFDLDPTMDPSRSSPRPLPIFSQAPPPSTKSPLSQQPQAPSQTQSFRSTAVDPNFQPDLTPATRNLSDDDINQWLIKEPSVAGGVGSVLAQDPVAGLGNGSDGGMEMDWTGWDRAVRDFQTDLQQAQKGEDGFPTPGMPTMGDITDWW
jgi:hypothetical protein